LTVSLPSYLTVSTALVTSPSLNQISKGSVEGVLLALLWALLSSLNIVSFLLLSKMYHFQKMYIRMDNGSSLLIAIKNFTKAYI
jgi:hypothetical protein